MARYVFMGIGVVMILVGILLGAIRQYWLIPGYKKLTQQQREERADIIKNSAKKMGFSLGVMGVVMIVAGFFA